MAELLKLTKAEIKEAGKTLSDFYDNHFSELFNSLGPRPAINRKDSSAILKYYIRQLEKGLDGPTIQKNEQLPNFDINEFNQRTRPKNRGRRNPITYNVGYFRWENFEVGDKAVQGPIEQCLEEPPGNAPNQGIVPNTDPRRGCAVVYGTNYGIPDDWDADWQNYQMSTNPQDWEATLCGTEGQYEYYSCTSLVVPEPTVLDICDADTWWDYLLEWYIEYGWFEGEDTFSPGDNAWCYVCETGACANDQLWPGYEVDGIIGANSYENLCQSNPNYDPAYNDWSVIGYNLGDFNNDGVINILDVVAIVNGILGGLGSDVGFDGGQMHPSSDFNGDGVVNVLDVVAIVNYILDGETTTTCPAEIEWPQGIEEGSIRGCTDNGDKDVAWWEGDNGAGYDYSEGLGGNYIPYPGYKACNYNPAATSEDGSCEYNSCIGCPDYYGDNAGHRGCNCWVASCTDNFNPRPGDCCYGINYDSDGGGQGGADWEENFCTFHWAYEKGNPNDAEWVEGVFGPCSEGKYCIPYWLTDAQFPSPAPNLGYCTPKTCIETQGHFNHLSIKVNLDEIIYSNPGAPIEGLNAENTIDHIWGCDGTGWEGANDSYQSCCEYGESEPAPILLPVQLNEWNDKNYELRAHKNLYESTDDDFHTGVNISGTAIWKITEDSTMTEWTNYNGLIPGGASYVSLYPKGASLATSGGGFMYYKNGNPVVEYKKGLGLLGGGTGEDFDWINSGYLCEGVLDVSFEGQCQGENQSIIGHGSYLWFHPIYSFLNSYPMPDEIIDHENVNFLSQQGGWEGSPAIINHAVDPQTTQNHVAPFLNFYHPDNTAAATRTIVTHPAIPIYLTVRVMQPQEFMNTSDAGEASANSYYLKDDTLNPGIPSEFILGSNWHDGNEQIPVIDLQIDNDVYTVELESENVLEFGFNPNGNERWDIVADSGPTPTCIGNHTDYQGNVLGTCEQYMGYPPSSTEFMPKFSFGSSEETDYWLKTFAGWWCESLTSNNASGHCEWSGDSSFDEQTGRFGGVFEGGIAAFIDNCKEPELNPNGSFWTEYCNNNPACDADDIPEGTEFLDFCPQYSGLPTEIATIGLDCTQNNNYCMPYKIYETVWKITPPAEPAGNIGGNIQIFTQQCDELDQMNCQTEWMMLAENGIQTPKIGEIAYDPQMWPSQQHLMLPPQDNRTGLTFLDQSKSHWRVQNNTGTCSDEISTSEKLCCTNNGGTFENNICTGGSEIWTKITSDSFKYDHGYRPFKGISTKASGFDTSMLTQAECLGATWESEAGQTVCHGGIRNGLHCNDSSDCPGPVGTGENTTVSPYGFRTVSYPDVDRDDSPFKCMGSRNMGWDCNHTANELYSQHYIKVSWDMNSSLAPFGAYLPYLKHPSSWQGECQDGECRGEILEGQSCNSDFDCISTDIADTNYLADPEYGSGGVGKIFCHEWYLDGYDDDTIPLCFEVITRQMANAPGDTGDYPQGFSFYGGFGEDPTYEYKVALANIELVTHQGENKWGQCLEGSTSPMWAGDTTGMACDPVTDPHGTKWRCTEGWYPLDDIIYDTETDCRAECPEGPDSCVPLNPCPMHNEEGVGGVCGVESENPVYNVYIFPEKDFDKYADEGLISSEGKYNIAFVIKGQGNAFWWSGWDNDDITFSIGKSIAGDKRFYGGLNREDIPTYFDSFEDKPQCLHPHASNFSNNDDIIFPQGSFPVECNDLDDVVSRNSQFYIYPGNWQPNNPTNELNGGINQDGIYTFDFGDYYEDFEVNADTPQDMASYDYYSQSTWISLPYSRDIAAGGDESIRWGGGTCYSSGGEMGEPLPAEGYSTIDECFCSRYDNIPEPGDWNGSCGDNEICTPYMGTPNQCLFLEVQPIAGMDWIPTSELEDIPEYQYERQLTCLDDIEANINPFYSIRAICDLGQQACLELEGATWENGTNLCYVRIGDAQPDVVDTIYYPEDFFARELQNPDGSTETFIYNSGVKACTSPSTICQNKDDSGRNAYPNINNRWVWRRFDDQLNLSSVYLTVEVDVSANCSSFEHSIDSEKFSLAIPQDNTIITPVKSSNNLLNEIEGGSLDSFYYHYKTGVRFDWHGLSGWPDPPIQLPEMTVANNEPVIGMKPRNYNEDSVKYKYKWKIPFRIYDTKNDQQITLNFHNGSGNNQDAEWATDGYYQEIMCSLYNNMAAFRGLESQQGKIFEINDEELTYDQGYIPIEEYVRYNTPADCSMVCDDRNEIVVNSIKLSLPGIVDNPVDIVNESFTASLLEETPLLSKSWNPDIFYCRDTNVQYDGGGDPVQAAVDCNAACDVPCTGTYVDNGINDWNNNKKMHHGQVSWNIKPLFWSQFGFNTSKILHPNIPFIDPLDQPKIGMINKPDGTQSAGGEDGFLTDSLPSWYTSGWDSDFHELINKSNNGSKIGFPRAQDYPDEDFMFIGEYLDLRYYLNSKIDEENDELLSPWDRVCNPFNETLNDYGAIKYVYNSEYNYYAHDGLTSNNVFTSDNMDGGNNFTVINYDTISDCNNFSLNNEILQYDNPIVIKVGESNKTVDFNLISGYYCELPDDTPPDSDGYSFMPCNREVLFETDAFDQTWIHEAADGTHLYDIPISDLIYHLYSISNSSITTEGCLDENGNQNCLSTVQCINILSSGVGGPYNNPDEICPLLDINGSGSIDNEDLQEALESGDEIQADIATKQEETIVFYLSDPEFEGGRECSISVLLEDAEVASDGTDNLTQLQFAVGGAAFATLGELSSGLHKSVWEDADPDIPETTRLFPGMIPGTLEEKGDPSGITWAFTTGLMGSMPKDGEYDNNEQQYYPGGNRIAKAMCHTGENSIKILGGTDYVKVKNIRVESIYPSECKLGSDERRCGLTKDVYQRDIVFGWGAITDNSISREFDNLLNFDNCIYYGHCNQEGFCDDISNKCFGGSRHMEDCDGEDADFCKTTTLTRNGLISYDYKLKVDLENSNNIYAPHENFTGLNISAQTRSPIELKDFVERYNASNNKLISVVGYRENVDCNGVGSPHPDCLDQFDSLRDVCCDPLDGSINCFRNEQTQFMISNIDEYLEENDFEGEGAETPFLIVSGDIANSPLRFCSHPNFEDEFLIDSGGGFGSPEYSGLYVFNGESDINSTINYGTQDAEYDGWSSDGTPVISPGALEAGQAASLVMDLKRYFHYIYTENEEDLYVKKTNQIPINLLGVNPPNIHFLKYKYETKPQYGIQSLDLDGDSLTPRTQEIVIYNNLNKDLISEEYILENSSTDFGIKSVGGIDFTTWEAGDTQYKATLFYYPENLPPQEISEEFSTFNEVNQDGSISYVWDNLIEAVNNSPSKFQAYLAEYSDPNPNSNFKIVIIEATETGKQYNGILKWDLLDELVDTQPTFNNLANGEAYPILHVYEDFGEIKLFVAASDFDRLTSLSLSLSNSEPENIELSMVDESRYVNPQGLGIEYGYNWLIDGYVYPEHLAEPTGGGIIYDFEETTFTDLEQYPHDGFSGTPAPHQGFFAHYNAEIKIKSIKENWNGEADLAIRVIDDDTSYDKVAFRLIVHSVNDSPIIDPVGDTNIFINNDNYPNNTNVRVQYSDVEQGLTNLTPHSISIVDGKWDEDYGGGAGYFEDGTPTYCKKIEKATEFVNSYTVPAYIDGNQVLPEQFLIDAWSDELLNDNDFSDITSDDEAGNLNLTYWSEDKGAAYGGISWWYYMTDEDEDYIKVRVTESADSPSANWSIRLKQNQADLKDLPAGTILKWSGYLRGISNIGGQEAFNVYTTVRGWSGHGQINGAQSNIEIDNNWKYFEHIFQIPNYEPCECTGDWINPDAPHDAGNCEGDITNSEICNPLVFCKENDYCKEMTTASCSSDTDCIRDPYLAAAEFGDIDGLNAPADTDEYEVHMKNFSLKQQYQTGMIDDTFTNISCGEDVIFCRTLCYYSFGLSQETAEELCSFADYNDDGVINENDSFSCNQDVLIEPEDDSEPLVSEFRGGVDSKCNNKLSMIDLLYEFYAHYGTSIYPENHAFSNSCDNSNSPFLDAPNAGEIFNGEGCLTYKACQDYFYKNHFGVCTVDVGYSGIPLNNCLQYSDDENCIGDVGGSGGINSEQGCQCNDTNGCFHLASKQYGSDENNQGPGKIYYGFCEWLGSAGFDADGEQFDTITTIDYNDLTALLNDPEINQNYYFCYGGQQHNSFCEVFQFAQYDDEPDDAYNNDDLADSENFIFGTMANDGAFRTARRNDSYCEPWPVPNFLNFDTTSENYFKFLADTGFDYLKDYIYIEPPSDTIGQFYLRGGVKDTGINEDGFVTEKRTGFSKFKVTIDGGSDEGPQGSVASEARTTFGFTPDNFLFSIGGADGRKNISTSLMRSFDIMIHDYHEDTTEEDRIINPCNYSMGGVLNTRGECCNINPIDSNGSMLSEYYNDDNDKDGTNPIYYLDEYQTSLELYLQYFKDENSKWCHAEISSTDWIYGDKKENRNVGGFLAPNTIFNDLDYTVSYLIEIYDVVEDYDEMGDQDQREWWGLLVKDEETWVQKWNGLRREGWYDLFAERENGHPLGDTIHTCDGGTCSGGPNQGIECSTDDDCPNGLLLSSNYFSQNDESSTDIQTLVIDGIELDITWPSIYEFRVTSTDSYGISSVNSEYIDARDFIKLNQTLLTKYSPWQGFNVVTPACENIEMVRNPGTSLDNQGLVNVDGEWRTAQEWDDIFDWANWPFVDPPCDTVFDKSFWGFSQMRAQCSDGSYVMMADTGTGDTLNFPSFWARDEDINYIIQWGFETGWSVQISLTNNTELFLVGKPITISGTPNNDGTYMVVANDGTHIKVYDENIVSQSPGDGGEVQQTYYASANDFTWTNGNEACRQIENTEIFIENRDRDKRPSLGLWYYDDLPANKASSQGIDWSERHNTDFGHAYSKDLIGSFSASLDTDNNGIPDGDTESHEYSWFPDADIRSTISIGSSNSVLYKYYDEDLQPLAYNETKSPLTAQVFFYARMMGGKNLIDKKTHNPDFRVYPEYHYAEYEDGGWWRVPTYFDGTESEFLSSQRYDILPYQEYTESFLVRHDNTLNITSVTFHTSDGNPNGHHHVPVEIIDHGDYKEVIATWKNDVGATNVRAIDFKANGDATYLEIKNPKLVAGTKESLNLFSEQSYELEGSEFPINKKLLNEGRLYVGFLDWGDGSKIEYDKEPFQLGTSKLLRHTYEKSGVYEIKGDMFKVGLATEGDLIGKSKGILNYKEFIFRINVSKNANENEFKLLGGDGYTFIPYAKDTPVVSGTSEYSLYTRLLKSLNGIIPTIDDLNIDVPYKYLGDKLDSEIALATLDEKLQLPLMSAFTGSLAYEISGDITEDDEIIINVQDDSCEYSNELGAGDEKGFLCVNQDSDIFGQEFIIDSGTYGEFDNAFRAAFLDCEDECINVTKAKGIRGFFEGQVDPVTGNLQPDDPNDPGAFKPKLINKGLRNVFGSLGDYLGDSDIAQVRYFDKPVQMWEMLGFQCDEIGYTDTIPLDRAHFGINYRNHSGDVVENSEENMVSIPGGAGWEQATPSGQLEATRIYLPDDGNLTNNQQLRFGTKFQMDEEGLGYWEYDGISGTSGQYLTNPNLKENETYTWSTHLYIPSERPDGTPQYFSPYGLGILYRQTEAIPDESPLWVPRDWTYNIRENDGSFHNQQILDYQEELKCIKRNGNAWENRENELESCTKQGVNFEECPDTGWCSHYRATEFYRIQYDSYWHCHPQDTELGIHAHNIGDNAEPYPMITTEDENGSSKLNNEWKHWFNVYSRCRVCVETGTDNVVDCGTGAAYEPNPSPPPNQAWEWVNDEKRWILIDGIDCLDDNWTKGIDAELIDDGDGQYTINIINGQGSSGLSDMQFYQQEIPITEGMPYTIKFKMKASQPRTGMVRIIERGTDFNNDGNKYSMFFRSDDFDVTTSFQEYEFHFIAGNPDYSLQQHHDIKSVCPKSDGVNCDSGTETNPYGSISFDLGEHYLEDTLDNSTITVRDIEFKTAKGGQTLSNGESCWTAETDGNCTGACYWYNEGAYRGHGETLANIPLEEIIFDEWFRVSGTFTTLPYPEYGNYPIIYISSPVGNASVGVCQCQNFEIVDPAYNNLSGYPSCDNSAGGGTGPVCFDGQWGTFTSGQKAGDSVYVWGQQIEIGDQLSAYTTVDVDPGNCSKADSGNPNHIRYYENIIPENLPVTSRRGVSALPPLPNSNDSKFEVVFNWGSIDESGITLNNGVTYGFIPIKYSLSPGDDITKIEFLFNGLELPDLTDDYSDDLGGIINNFGFILSTENKNKLILRYPGCDDDSDALDCDSLQATSVNPIENELLVNVPFVFRDDNEKISFESIDVYTDISGEELTTNGTFDNGADGWILNGTTQESGGEIIITGNQTFDNRISQIHDNTVTVDRNYRLHYRVVQNTLTNNPMNDSHLAVFHGYNGTDGSAPDVETPDENGWYMVSRYGDTAINTEFLMSGGSNSPYDVEGGINYTESFKLKTDAEVSLLSISFYDQDGASNGNPNGTHNQVTATLEYLGDEDNDGNYVYRVSANETLWSGQTRLRAIDFFIQEGGAPNITFVGVKDISLIKTGSEENFKKLQLGGGGQRYVSSSHNLEASSYPYDYSYDFVSDNNGGEFVIQITSNAIGGSIILDNIELREISATGSNYEEILTEDMYMYQEFGNLYPWVNPNYQSLGNIYINEQSSQNWVDDDNNTYYYPVLPKYNRIAEFDEQQDDGTWEFDLGLQGGHIPFGSPGRKWDEDDLYAAITSTTLPSTWINYCLIDLDFNRIQDNALSDIGPVSNNGMLIDDYGLDYTKPVVSFIRKKPQIRTKISKKNKAY